MIETLISAIGCAAGAFFCMAILARDPSRSPRTVYLSIATGLLAANLGEDALSSAHAYDAAPWAFGWSYPAFAFIGPMLWLHVAAHVDPIDAGWSRARRHVTAAGALLLLLTPWAMSGEHRWRIEQGAVLESPFVWPATVSLLLFMLVSALQLMVYLASARRRARAVVDPTARAWLVRLTTVAMVAWAVYFAALAALLAGVESVIAVTLTNAILALSIYGLAITAIATPPDPLSVPPPANAVEKAAKYARSALTDGDIDRLMGKLSVAVRERSIHRDPTLTLHKLASAVGASPNDLSQALNLRAEGFHAWLSAVRIREVQDLLRGGVDVSGLLDAAYAAGFNSKSTFYDAFRRVTGLTPAAWRAQLDVERGGE